MGGVGGEYKKITSGKPEVIICISYLSRQGAAVRYFENQDLLLKSGRGVNIHQYAFVIDSAAKELVAEYLVQAGRRDQR
jgi:hypothetical protein